MEMCKVLLIISLVNLEPSLGIRLAMNNFDNFEDGSENAVELDFTQAYSKGGKKTQVSGDGLGAHCDKPTEVKAAVLLFGMSRSIVEIPVQEGIQEHIVQAMAKAGVTGLARTTPDIFAHVKVGQN